MPEPEAPRPVALLRYGEGVFRRAYLLVGSEGRVVAEMEDDFHRFRVTLEHDGSRVVRIAGEAFRYPWTECPGAIRVLAGLAGRPGRQLQQLQSALRPVTGSAPALAFGVVDMGARLNHGHQD